MPERSKSPGGQLPQKYRFVFLTLPNYTMIALASAVDALRVANRVTKREAYEWALATLDGTPASASNGLSMAPTIALDAMGSANIVFVVGGVNVEQAVTPALLSTLRAAETLSATWARRSNPTCDTGLRTRRPYR